MSRRRAQVSNSQPVRDFFRWTDEMNIKLLNAMCDEAHKGFCIDGSWTPQGYTNIVQALNEAGFMEITKNHVKNRLKTLKDRWREVHDLFNGLSGFAWNPVTNKFEAEPEVWDKLIKAKPSAAKWRNTAIKHYDILEELYGVDRVAGNEAFTPSQILGSMMREHLTIDLNDAVNDSFINDAAMGNFQPFEGSPPPSASYSPHYTQSIHSGNNDDSTPSAPNAPSSQSGGTSTLRGIKRKAPMTEIIDAQMEKLNFSFEVVVEAIKSGNILTEKLSNVAERQVGVAEQQLVIAQRSMLALERRNDIMDEQTSIMRQGTKVEYSEGNIWDLVCGFNLHDQDYALTCYNFLCNHPSEACILFGLPPELRLLNLYRVMHGDKF